MNAHPIRKHITMSVTLTLAEAEALAGALPPDTQGLRGVRSALTRGLSSLRWLPQLERQYERAGMTP